MTEPTTSMDAAERLLPCPFCGGAARIQHTERGQWQGYAGRCSECEAEGQACASAAAAVAAWNRRTSQQQPNTQEHSQ